MLWWRSISAAFALAALAFAAAHSVRFAKADYLFSVADRRDAARAAAADPGRALYRMWQAELAERAGENPVPMLRSAAALSPRDEQIRMRLGLREEMAGELEAAEASLLAAAAISRKYAPRWTLANYYFRRGNQPEFWRWAREALLMSYGDRTPLFRLCWQVSPDAQTILEKAIPDRREVRLAWLAFLASGQEYEELARRAGEWSAGATAPETPLFLGITDTLLSQGEYRQARQIWDHLAEEADRPGGVVTNGDFRRPASGKGFDWRLRPAEGVFSTQTPGELTLSLNGRQPERCELLSQFVVLEPGSYRLTARHVFLPSGLAAENTGLWWSVRGGDGRILAEAAVSPSEGAGVTGIAFTVPAGVSGARLVLDYRRPSGSTRLEGVLRLHRVRVTRTGARVQAQ